MVGSNGRLRCFQVKRRQPTCCLGAPRLFLWGRYFQMPVTWSCSRLALRTVEQYEAAHSDPLIIILGLKNAIIVAFLAGQYRNECSWVFWTFLLYWHVSSVSSSATKSALLVVSLMIIQSVQFSIWRQLWACFISWECFLKRDDFPCKCGG